MDIKILCLFFLTIYLLPFNYIVIFIISSIIININSNNLFSSEIDNNINKLNEFKKYDLKKYNKFNKKLKKLKKYIMSINTGTIETEYDYINKSILILREMINELHEISYSIKENNKFKHFNYIIKEIYNYYYKILYKYIQNYNQKFNNNPLNNISPIYMNAPSIDLINKGDYTTFNNEQAYNNYSSSLLY